MEIYFPKREGGKDGGEQGTVFSFANRCRDIPELLSCLSVIGESAGENTRRGGAPGGHFRGYLPHTPVSTGIRQGWVLFLHLVLVSCVIWSSFFALLSFRLLMD